MSDLSAPDRIGIAAVTGSAQGIGRGIAEELARAGYDILLFDLEEAAQGAAQTIEHINRVGRSAAFVAVDVRDVEVICDALDRGIQALGTPTIWVNNAGTVSRKPALEVTLEEWRRVVDTCLTGTFFCSQSFARRLVEEGRHGVVVNIASVFGVTAGPRRAAYSAAKAGIVNLTRVLAHEWHPYGIRVNAVAPTFVETPMTVQLLREGLDVVNKSFGERLATVADVAHAVTFLAGSEAEMVNGHTLAVDGGWLAW